MKRTISILGVLIIASGIVILLLGCPPPVVRVRPPDPRIEVYGSAPYPEAAWIPGYWRHKRGDWVWAPGHWERRPKPHAVWVPGRWEARGGGWVWVKGHWDYR